jgi:hypothetical protein
MDVTIAHKRYLETDDGAGGTTTTLSTVTASLACSKHLYGSSSEARLEHGSGSAPAGPGATVRERRMFLFGAGTDVRADDVLTEGGRTWHVRHVRAYDYSTQADCEMWG